MSDQRYTDALLANGKLREERDRLREALERIVREWEAAPGPVYDQLRKYWLVETMTPAIDAARAVLAKEAGQ